MKIELLQHSDINIIDKAISQCWSMPSRDEDHMLRRMNRVVNKNHHESVSEHYHMTWQIDNIPRFVLQELSRHRIGISLSVKSSRYTLQELKNQPAFEGRNWKNAKNFIYLTGDAAVDNRSIAALNALQELVKRGMKNDLIKACMPESYLTSLVLTANIRSFKHFYQLRTSPAALKEIGELARGLYEAMPDDVKFLIVEEKENEKNS